MAHTLIGLEALSVGLVLVLLAVVTGTLLTDNAPTGRASP